MTNDAADIGPEMETLFLASRDVTDLLTRVASGSPVDPEALRSARDKELRAMSGYVSTLIRETVDAFMNGSKD